MARRASDPCPLQAWVRDASFVRSLVPRWASADGAVGGAQRCLPATEVPGVPRWGSSETFVDLGDDEWLRADKADAAVDSDAQSGTGTCDSLSTAADDGDCGERACPGYSSSPWRHHSLPLAWPAPPPRFHSLPTRCAPPAAAAAEPPRKVAKRVRFLLAVEVYETWDRHEYARGADPMEAAGAFAEGLEDLGVRPAEASIVVRRGSGSVPKGSGWGEMRAEEGSEGSFESVFWLKVLKRHV